MSYSRLGLLALSLAVCASQFVSGEPNVIYGPVGSQRCSPPGTNCEKEEACHNHKNCTRGPRGPRGDSGPTGQQGVRGPMGFDGSDGSKGPTGPRGFPGKIGPMGQTGEPGMPGFPGLPGDPGLKGADGPQGIPGPEGKPGFPGAPGKNGADGRPGDKGQPGIDGRDGPIGEPGFPGINGLHGQPGRDGPPGCHGKKGAKGPPGPTTEWPCKVETPPICNVGLPGSTLVARHSQSPFKPSCPEGGMELWEGFSMLHSEDDSNSNHQDLGTASSCVETFNPLPFMFCNIHGRCTYGSRTGKSFWLSSYRQDPTMMPFDETTAKARYVSRCVVCQMPSMVMAKHGKTRDEAECPSYWKPLWKGRSFLMHTVGASGGGQQLMSPGSCLENYTPHPFIECGSNGNCHYYTNKYSFWMVNKDAINNLKRSNNPFPTDDDPSLTIKEEAEQLNVITHCTVCLMTCNDVSGMPPAGVPWKHCHIHRPQPFPVHSRLG